MQENLKIAGRTLTPANSNVTSNFTLPAVATTAPANNFSVTNPAYSNTSPYNADPYGYLYNWATAIAYSTTQYGTGSNNTSQDIVGNASYSICPKGWRLPVGGAHTSGSTTGTNEFALVGVNSFGGTGMNQNNSTLSLKWRSAAAFAIVYNGDFANGAFSLQGTDTGFWSASSGNPDYGSSFEINGTYVGPQYTPPKTSGYSIRCIFGG
jgi:uncharacterized protein (TIGR02145 family)